MTLPAAIMHVLATMALLRNLSPIWSCSDCGRDYDPASCSIIKYCYICGAKMDGGKDND